jgi:peptide/nickel transport system permease protein/oligopeptide transport system permease protein
MLTGYWGRSLISGLDVSYLVFHRFRYTLALSIFSMAIEISVGLLLGIIAAYKAGSRLDRGLRFITIFGWSLPSFLVGIVLIYIFALQLRWFPPLGAGDISHLILPGLTLAVGGVTYISRMTRGSMLEVAGQDFVRTAKAKGLKKRRIMLKHVMRNALLPIVTMLGISFGGSLSGAFIVETIFSYPGIGYLAVQSVSTRDYAVVQGCVIFIAFIYCTINLVVDILYAYLDPRVRYERRV